MQAGGNSTGGKYEGRGQKQPPHCSTSPCQRVREVLGGFCVTVGVPELWDERLSSFLVRFFKKLICAKGAAQG